MFAALEHDALMLSGQKTVGPIRLSIWRLAANIGAMLVAFVALIVGGGFMPGKTQAEVKFGRRKCDSVTIASNAPFTVASVSSSTPKTIGTMGRPQRANRNSPLSRVNQWRTATSSE